MRIPLAVAVILVVSLAIVPAAQAISPPSPFIASGTIDAYGGSRAETAYPVQSKWGLKVTLDLVITFKMVILEYNTTSGETNILRAELINGVEENGAIVGTLVLYEQGWFPIEYEAKITFNWDGDPPLTEIYIDIIEDPNIGWVRAFTGSIIVLRAGWLGSI